MAKYRTPEEKIKYRKQQKRRKLAMYSCMAAFVLVASFIIVKVVEMMAGGTNSNTQIFVAANIQQPNTDVVKLASSWEDYTGDVPQTINLYAPAGEISMIQVMETDNVDISYFNDVLFLGDSLADGFRVYNSSLALKDTTAGYLTRKSTTPRSFLQPGVMVDAGAGYVDVWATIEQKQPKKMYITLGTNALMSMEPEAFIESYRQLIDKIKSVTPETIIYVTTITPVTAWITPQKPQLSFDRIYRSNQLIAQMCVEKDLALINLYDVLKSSSGYLREDIAAGDGYHLTPNGYREWLDYLISHTTYHPSNIYV